MPINKKIKIACLIFSLLVSNSLNKVFAIYDFSKSPWFEQMIIEKDKKLKIVKTSGMQWDKYSYQCDDSILSQRYERLCKEKWQLYFINPNDRENPGVLGIYKDEFKVPDNWKTKLKTRHDYPYAFEYNLAHESYNSSLIFSLRNCFLAIEAPSSKNIDSFFELVDKYDISHFVKLNSPDEYGEDYYPFWEDRKTSKEDLLKFKKGEVEFLNYKWPHKKEADPQVICEMIDKIHNTDTDKIIAVSCRAGAGRTATFIAAYMLLDEVKNQISKGVKLDDIDISIDKIVWNILVQRPYAIAFCAQYINLYRIVDYYISCLITTQK